MQSDLFKAIFKAYTRTIMSNNVPITMFIEKHRSRSGKIQQPSNPIYDFVVNNSFASNEVDHHIL